MSDQPTQPGGWGPPPEQPPQRPRGEPPPPSDEPPWWRRTWVIALAAFVAGALVGNAGASPSQEVRTVTVTSIVTSLVPATTVQATTTAAPTTRRPTTTRRPATTRPPARNCDSSYPDFCIPSPPPDLDCPDVAGSNFTVRPPDPHGFDSDNDRVGCER
jgi:hypothetical protein